MTSFSRRRFLVLAGGAAVLVACGSDREGSPRTEDRDPVEPGAGSPRPITEVELTDASAGVVSSDLFASDEPQRLAIAILATTDDGSAFASGLPARIAVFPPGRTVDEPEWLEPVLHTEGLPERRGVYTLDLALAEAGIWQALLDYDDRVSEFAFTVREEPAAPAVGGPAPRVPTATTAEPLDVDLLCTREPPCALHERSLSDVVGAGTPVVVQFSTPARCQTQYCGPTLDTMLELVPDYEGVAFVHVEIYPDLSSPRVVDAVGPDGWHLPSEPWMYAIDGDGRITDRLDGAFATDELRAALDRLTS